MARPQQSEPKPPIPPWAAGFLIVTVGVVWAAVIIADILVREYEPPSLVHGVFGSVLAAVVGVTNIMRGRNGG